MKELCPQCNKFSIKVIKYANWKDRTCCQDSICETPNCEYRHEIKNSGNIYVNGRQFNLAEGIGG